MTADNLAAALWYAGLGRRVFPCIEHAGAKAKSPYTPNGFKDATTDPDQIRCWWTEHPNALIGAPPYPDEVVLDIDPRNGGSVEALEALIGQTLPDTATAYSGRNDGGMHLHFKRPAGQLASPKDLKQRLGPGYDLKKPETGYVILPPSLHPETRQPYRWREPVASVEEMPPALVEHLRPPAPRAASTNGASAPLPHAAGQNPAYVEAAVRDELDKLRATTTDRNDQLNESAFNLGQFVGAGEVDEQETTDALIETARQLDTNPSDPFTDAEIYKTVRSGLEAGKRQPRWAPPPTTPPIPPVTVLSEEAADDERSRWTNLDQFLDGTYTPEEPDIGAIRDDGIQLLYSGRWHTLIALTAAGKTTFALWQVKSVLEWGGHVVYIHFEEAIPNGIIHRLRGLGVSIEAIRERFHWGHVDTPWKWGEMAAEIERLEVPPQLAVLDGTNAACGQHGWAVKEPESVGLYRAMFVHPLTKVGTAVLSLGHPPKAMNRQGESYSYGAAGWLNDVDGVGYKMTASKTPIGKGRQGSSALHSVKDRYGGVERWGELQSDDGMPRYYIGQFVVDDTLPEDTSGLLPKTAIHLTIPARNEEGGSRDKIDDLCGHILTHLRETTGKFKASNKLMTDLQAKGVHFTKTDLSPALQRLENRRLIEWPDAPDGKPRPGWLTDSAINPEGE